jgi:hypothetical protein
MKRLLAALLLASQAAWGQNRPSPAPISAPPGVSAAPLPAAPAVAPTGACEGKLGEGPPSVVCFDPGHRLYVSGGTDGFGLGIQLRHEVKTDDPGVTWRTEHGVVRAISTDDRFRGVVYEGRFLRHSREGYLLFPGNPPRRLPVPFDVGLELAAGRVEGRRSEAELRLNAVRGALMVDLARSDTFRRRATVGAVTRWDMKIDRERRTITEQAVAPFTVGAVGLYVESASGLTLAGLSGEAGYATLGRGVGWRPVLGLELIVERVLLALNDLPLSVYGLGRYEEPGAGLRGEIGLRFSLLAGAR